jgi:GAF domain-containing protein
MYDFKQRDDGLGYLLELAMDKIACEAGFVLLTRGDQLRFAVGRGAKAAEVLKAGIPIPVGTGITGFCAQELVCLAVSDVEKDRRFFRRISRAVGYETRSILCSPVVKAGRVYGTIELKNKKGGAFDGADLAVLAYLAHQAANLLELREAFEPL